MEEERRSGREDGGRDPDNPWQTELARLAELAGRTGVGRHVHTAGMSRRVPVEPLEVEDSNGEAVRAALELARAPVPDFHLLFVFGREGVGKSHLLRLFRSRLRPGTLLLRTDPEKLARGVGLARRANEESYLRALSPRLECLLLDEAHRLRGKPKAQQELLGVLKILLDRRCRVLVASRHSPRDIYGLSDGLRSLFLSGLVVRIETPSPELRRRLLARRLAHEGLRVPDRVLDHLLRRLPAGGVSLPGSWIRWLREKSGMLSSRSPEAWIREMEGSWPVASGEPIRRVVDALAREFGIDPDTILHSRRSPAASLARKIAIHLLRRLSIPARELVAPFHLAGRESVQAGWRRFRRRLREDPGLASRVEELARRLAPGAQDDSRDANPGTRTGSGTFGGSAPPRAPKNVRGRSELMADG